VNEKQLTTLTNFKIKHMQYLFLRDDLKFLKQSDIDFEIVNKKLDDPHWCVVEIRYTPDLLFKAFRSGVHCSIDKININDFA
jgi:hypothetical protein